MAPGVFRDNHGHAIIVKRHGRYVEKRYGPEKTLGWLKNERQTEIDKLEKKGPVGGAGTLKGDVAEYLKTLPEGRPKKDREQWLAPWVVALGDVQRAQITPQRVRETMAGWKKAAATLNHRRHALKALYKALDGPDAATPCDHLSRAVETREIRTVPRGVILAILRQLRPNKAGARLKVLARTGLPHAQIGRLHPHDVDLKARTMHVTPRRKGAGTRARTIPLTHTAVRAFKQFARADAWGPFSSQNLYKTFQLAVSKAKDAWPGRWPCGHIRPYDLRHAYLTEVYRRTRDLRATSELAMHADLTMTARYAEAAVSATASAARDAMDGTRRKQAVK